MNRQYKITSFIIMVSIALILALTPLQYSFAQTDNDTWSPPTNLSQSGSTTDPAFVIDNMGTLHVVWMDAYVGTVYSKLEGYLWSEPVAVDFPFESTKLTFIPDNGDYIHAFWVEVSETDEETTLLYSRVLAEEFGNFNAWVSPVIVAQAVTSFDVSIENDGFLHLAYIRPLENEEFPTGVYYRQSIDAGITWTPASILDQSPYFRSLSEEDVNISIASLSVNGSSKVFLTWDNLPQRRVYYTQSNDAGITWKTPVEVDKPDVETNSYTPINPNVIANDEEIILKWQLQNPEERCIHYYQLSTDGGISWSDRYQMLNNIDGCAQDSNFYIISDGFLLLQTTIKGQVFLLVWDGIQWSDPQLQLPLSKFVDPETSRNISYGCRQYDYHAEDDRLISVGCEVDLESIGIGDTWTTSLPIGDKSHWFPSPSRWTNPIMVTSVTGKISSPVMVHDPDVDAYLFWIQTKENDQGNIDSNIYTSSWDGDTWELPLPLFKMFSNNASHLASTIGPNGLIYLVWNDNQTGELFFSWTDSERVNRSDLWIKPQLLPTYGLAARKPVIFVNKSKKISVAYVVPLNEGRGVYITQSSDGGRTWTDPRLVFDAENAGWDMVGQPSLAGTMGGKLHILWTQKTFPDGIGPLKLYYTSSEDGGLAWNTPEIVVEGSAVWYQILGYGEQVLHQFWQEIIQEYSFVYHRVSYDGGLTWDPPTSMTSAGTPSGTPAVTIDDTGQLHLLQIFREDEDNFVLRNWQWDGERWFAEETLNLESEDQMFLDIAANISNESRLGAIYTAAQVATNDRDYGSEMHFTSRYVGDSAPIPIPLVISDTTPLPTEDEVKTPTSTLTPTPFQTSTPTQTLSPTFTAPKQTESSTNLESNSSTSGDRHKVIISWGLTAEIIVIAIFGIYLYRRFRSEKT
ncbi:sialidase family protein [Chloroflexota bacterium]